MKHLYTFILLFAMLIISIIATPSPVAAFEQAVQPAEAAPGSIFAFYATGFDAEEWVTFWVNDPAGNVHEGGSVRCNHLNRADWTWASPSQAPYGRWSMVARGRSSQIERVIFFEIVPIPTGQSTHPPAGYDEDAYQQAISPRVGAPGTEFGIFATGFEKYERVVFRAYDPAGQEYEIGAFGTNKHGRVDWTWKSPPAMIPGYWTIVAQGDRSHVERCVTVEIIPAESFPELAEPQDTYDNAVAPGRGTPGTRFYFFAANFHEGEPVEYQIIAPDGVVVVSGETHAAWNTRADWVWESPKDTVPGIWTARAVGIESRIEYVLSFEVYAYVSDWTVPSQQDPYDSAVFPAHGKPGTTFAFFATGYVHEEYVDYACIGSDSIIYTTGSVKTSEFGRADWTCESPYIAPAGIWTTVARGRSSGLERTLHFTIYQP